MSEAFESIKRGLTQAIAHEKGKGRGVRLHTPSPLDIQALRKKVGMTQEEFAARFGISLGTLRHWERGDRRPHGTALVLLQVIDKKPRAVLDALS
jgi:putative transcriptional regulator